MTQDDVSQVEELLRPLQPGERRLQPSALGRFISYDQCQRLFRLDLYDNTTRQQLHVLTETRPEYLPPVLTEAGDAWERAIEAALIDAGWFVSNLRHDSRPGLAFAIMMTGDGERRIVLQSHLDGVLGGWRICSKPDLIVIDKTEPDRLKLLIADLKSSRSVQLAHRLQVAIYALLAAELFPDAEVAQAVLYREPVGPAEIWTDEELAHQQAARECFGLEYGALLALADRPHRYAEQIQRTVLAPGSLANRIAEAHFHDLPFHLAAKCDGCEFNEYCLHSAQESQDLSLIPYLTERSKRLLLARGVETVEELRTVAHTDNARYAALQVTPPLGHRLGELIRRAQSFTQWQAGERVDTRLPEFGYSSLPATGPDLHPNLIRIFIDLQRDTSQGRVYLLGALVSCLTDGTENSAREETVIRLAETPVENDSSEAALVSEWIRDVLVAVQRNMSPGGPDQHSAPVHFYLWDQAQINVLQSLVNRQHGAVIGIEAVMALMMQPAAFDTSNVSTVADEVQQQRALPMLCQSLQAVASFLRFRWPDEIKDQFYYRVFDAVRVETDDDGAHLVPQRSRFRSEIPSEYAYRAWGIDGANADDDEAPDTEQRRSWTLYKRPSLEQLREFQRQRLAALKYITSQLRTNRHTTKSQFDLSVLTRLRLRPERPIEAIREFISVERHIELSEWRRTVSLGIDSRVKRGVTLVARYLDADQNPDVRKAMRDARTKQAEIDAIGPEFWERSSEERKPYSYSLADLEIRVRIDPADLSIPLADVLLLTQRREGDFVVVAPAESIDTRPEAADREPFQTTARQILAYHGRAVIDKITAEGSMHLTLRGGRRGTTGFVWGPSAKPIDDGALITIDDDPDSWPMNRQWMVVEAIREGRAHAGYDWIAEAIRPLPTWTKREADAQASFMEGLLRFGDFEENPSRYESEKQKFIGQHGDAPMILVQGPPGTGKSTTTGWAVWSRIQGALASGREYRIAVSCRTHGATDVLLEDIIGARERLRQISIRNPEFFARYFDHRLLSIPVFRAEPKDPANVPVGSRAFTAKTVSAQLNEAKKWDQVIVGATTNGHGKLANTHWRDGDLVWDLVIVDEASQMSVPEFLVASIGLKRDGRIIVVGDHRQMPPIVRQNWEEGETESLDPYAMYRSIFDVVRFDARPRVDIKFAESFRVHRDVAEYLRSEVYVEDGIDFHSRKRDLFVAPSDDEFASAVIEAPYPLILVVHDEDQSQQRNELEQTLTQRILYALTEMTGDKPAGVVVPHRAQRSDLRKEIIRRTGDRHLADSVDTVERFQGDERQIIIYSATESDPAYLRDTGAFLFDPRRLTVAISRARTKLVVIASKSIFDYLPADEASLNNSAIWRNLRDKACTLPVWSGEIDGHRIEVRANPQLAEDRPVPE